MASTREETYCLCGQPYNIGQFMIECDCCREWFHGSCVNVRIYQSDDIDKYHCPKCSQTYGPSILKVTTNNHRQDRYELDAVNKPIQIGSPVWLQELNSKHLKQLTTILNKLHAQQFNEEFIKNNGFTRPVFFHTPEGLDLRVPNPATFTVRSVLRYCGAQMEVEVIDVRKQASVKMPLGDFVDYFETPPHQRDGKVLNVLSLEFSDTPMSNLVSAPGVTRKLDWSKAVWPSESKAKPAVQKYCIMSAGGAYTDFHLDFGGTSVWYHVLHGRKIFYLIPPTASNLSLYQQWNLKQGEYEKFFGDLCDGCGTVDVCPGETLFIPSGWIHAVYTPEDSLVFGGNFLHSYAIEMQLKVYEIECHSDTPSAFRYPLFETLNWYAAQHLLQLLRRYNEESQDEDFAPHDSSEWSLPESLMNGLKAMAPVLKEWHSLRASVPQKKNNIPSVINSGQLVRDLFKELKKLDRLKVKNIKPKDPTFKASAVKAKRKKINTADKKPVKITLPKSIMTTHASQQQGNNAQPLYAQQNEPYDTVNKDYSGVKQEHYQIENFDGYEKKTIIRMKLSTGYPSSSNDMPPPAYSLPDPSILKAHLINRNHEQQTNQNQWTISKDHADQQILYTNENNMVGENVSYGPGMYSTEDLQGEFYQKYPPDYSHYQNNTIADMSVNYETYKNEMDFIVDESKVLTDMVVQHMQGNLAGQMDDRAAQGLEQGGDRLMRVDASERLQHIVTQERIMQQQIGSGRVLHNQIVSEGPRVLEASGHVGNDSGYMLPGNGAVDTPTYTHHPTPVLPPSYENAIASVNLNNGVKTEEKITSSPPVRRSERATRKRQSPTYHYDDSPLFIDEAPRSRKPVVSSNFSRNVPTNGIESLIQASVIAGNQGDPTENAAVAGMLSMGRSPVKAKSKKVRREMFSSDEEAMDDSQVIKEVHRDDEYVYPSLEMSSDEEEYDYKSKRRQYRAQSDKDKDECWSPKARLGRLVPRVSRPARPGVKREAVRKALQAAATQSPKPAPSIKPLSLPAKRSIAVHKPVPVAPPRPPTPPPPSSQPTKLKKGMKTAKQRLGKILKIHKMRY